MTITVKDASQLPVNSDIHVDKQYVIYMTEEILGIRPALQFPYTEGDAGYLEVLGVELNGYSQLIVDIEYLPTSPATIVWATDDPAYRVGAVDLLVDWMQKFRVGYSGSLGVYGALPNFIEWAWNVELDRGAALTTIAYDKDYLYATQAAPLVAEADVLYPSFYMSEFDGLSFTQRINIFTRAVNKTKEVLGALYPGKRIEPFLRFTDLDARISHLNSAGFPAVNIWEAASGSFSDAQIDIINSYADLGASQSSTDFYYHAVNDGPINPDASPYPSNYLVCQRSGFRVSVAEGLQKTWDGLFVRSQDFDQRHPQDFVRVRVERQSGSYSPELPDSFISRLEAGTFSMENGEALILEDGDGFSFEAA